MIAAIIMIVEMIWQLFGLSLKVIGLALEAMVTILGGTISVVDWIFTSIRSMLVLLGGWLGPIGNSVMWALSYEEVKRAAIMAFGIASVLWVLFSTIANDAFYLMINPFFLNLFTTIGHFGFSIVIGLGSFVMDLFRRLTQGPTKKQLELMKTFK